MATGEARLRAAGVRVTPQRVAALAVLDRAGREGAHLLATEVAERCAEILGQVAVQTIYDCLDALVAAGLVRRVPLPEGPARFESSSVPEHHHLVCSSCGGVVGVPGTATADLPEAAAMSVEGDDGDTEHHRKGTRLWRGKSSCGDHPPRSRDGRCATSSTNEAGGLRRD